MIMLPQLEITTPGVFGRKFPTKEQDTLDEEMAAFKNVLKAPPDQILQNTCTA